MQIDRISFQRLISDGAGYGNRKVEVSATLDPGEDAKYMMDALRGFVYATLDRDIKEEHEREEEERRQVAEAQQKAFQEDRERKARRMLQHGPNPVRIVELCDAQDLGIGDPFETERFVIEHTVNFRRSFMDVNGKFYTAGMYQSSLQLKPAVFDSEEEARIAWVTRDGDTTPGDKPADIFADQ